MAIVTTVEMVHTELFGTVADVGLAKGELVEALPAGGTAVLNADNPLVAAMAERTRPGCCAVEAAGAHRHSRRLDVWASDVTMGDDLRPRFRLHSPWGEVDVHLGVRGGHNVTNALAAAGAALAVGVDLASVADRPGPGRVVAVAHGPADRTERARVLNDAYNAGPASMAAALRALAVNGSRAPGGGAGADGGVGRGRTRRPPGHRRVGGGPRGRRWWRWPRRTTAPRCATWPTSTAPWPPWPEAGPLDADVAVLVKGSRVAGLERLAAALLAETG